jgi:hypothetical protein
MLGSAEAEQQLVGARAAAGETRRVAAEDCQSGSWDLGHVLGRLGSWVATRDLQASCWRRSAQLVQTCLTLPLMAPLLPRLCAHLELLRRAMRVAGRCRAGLLCEGEGGKAILLEAGGLAALLTVVRAFRERLTD